MNIEFESMNDVFHKVHVRGAPADFILHEFTGPDEGAPHDHNFDLHINVLKGGYIEERYDRLGNVEVIERRPGDSFTIPHDAIHRIVRLLDGPCMTMATYGPWVQEPGFWRFDHGVAMRRQWNSDQWVRM